MSSSPRIPRTTHGIALVLALVLVAPTLGHAQARGNPDGEWRFQSADSWGTRYSPVDEINAMNFRDLEVAWEWRADNFGPDVDYQMKSTPTYIDGILYTGRRSAPHGSRHRSRDR